PAQAGGVGQPAAVPRSPQAGQAEVFGKLSRVSGLIPGEWTGFRLDALPVPSGASRWVWPLCHLDHPVDGTAHRRNRCGSRFARLRRFSTPPPPQEAPEIAPFPPSLTRGWSRHALCLKKRGCPLDGTTRFPFHGGAPC